MDKQKHKLYMAQILSSIFKDKDLCNVLGFKGGTALMFFHNLPRFSTDLDFNLLDTDKLDVVYARVRKILLRFGIIDDTKVKPQFIKIKVNAGQANYIRDLRLHESQEEIECNDEYSIFRYRLRPQYDFIQELLWNGGDVEVLEPKELREEIAEIIECMWDNYNGSKKKK